MANLNRFKANKGLDGNNFTITNVSDPIDPQDVATKAFASNASNISSGTLSIESGGTGQTTAIAAINALMPDQVGNTGKYLTTDGTVISWGTVTTGSSGTVTSVNGDGGLTGLTFSGGPITTSGTLTLGGTLATGSGGTGSATTFTQGSVVFAGSAGVYSQNNSELFWNATTSSLGIGTASPSYKLDVNSTAAAPIRIARNGGTDANTGIQVQLATSYWGVGAGSNDSFAITRNTLDFANSATFNIDASGNLGIGTSSPSVKLQVAGAMKGDGHAVQSYVGANGVPTTTNNVGLLLQNSTALNSTGAAAVTLQGIVSAPQVSHDATAGTTTAQTTGFLANPTVTSSAATSNVSFRGFHSVTQRSYTTDTSSAINSIRGVDVMFGHTATLPSTANTNNVQGIFLTGQMFSGTMNNRFSAVETLMQANPTTGSITVGSMAPIYANTSTIGTGAGTASVVNYYGLAHVGLTNGSNGTITNAYELYLGGIANSGTITNQYAIHQASTTLPNYFGGRVGIGTMNPRNKLDVAGSFGRGVPVTKTADFTVADTENWIINNKSGSTCNVTLPSAALFPGRELMFKNLQAQTVMSVSYNVIPRNGTVAGQMILASGIGAWVTLVSDGSNWVIMQGN